MSFEKIFEELNFLKQCRRYRISLWQCPSFLFILIGLVIIGTMLGIYFIANKYTQAPEMVALIILGVTTFLMIVGYSVIQGFNRLVEVNRMKSEFVSVASHQLRTPLTSLKWSLDMLLSGRLNDSWEHQLEQLKIAKENNQRMIDLVNDLLDVSRIEDGSLGLKPGKVNLLNLIQGLISEYDFLAKASNIILEFETKDDLSARNREIFADPKRIKLVINNLIDNAIRYTYGGGSVKIRLKNKNKLIRCEVEDNGAGVPKKEQKYIFQKFFRSQNIMKYQTEGTGLGLFIAKAIIEASGGKMGFESREKRGSVFWFELPIK
jgi:signal transduction histidine kinase